jgi:hypothetical protein
MYNMTYVNYFVDYMNYLCIFRVAQICFIALVKWSFDY